MEDPYTEELATHGGPAPPLDLVRPSTGRLHGRRRRRLDRTRRARPRAFQAARWPGLLLALVALGCGGVPPSPAPDAPDLPPDTVRVLAYNIHHGEGMDGRLDLERIGALIASLEPDLVALQEVDRGVERTERLDQAAALGELTGLEPAFGAFMDYQGGEYGMAVLSRWPVLERTNHRLPPGAEPRSALAVRVRSPATGRELVIVGVHLYRTEEERRAQASRLIDALEGTEAPVVLAGDFNSRPGSPVMALLSRPWRVIEKGDDHPTFPSDAPDREIDYVVVRPGHRFDVIEQRVIDELVASDHRPVLVTLALR